MEFGKVLDGRYSIQSFIGKGGMSDVYLVKNIKLESVWAMKRVSKDSGLKKDYRKELDILRKLNHNALPRIFDFFEDEEFLYLIIDYFDGKTLENEIAEDRIKIDKAVQIIRQLCDVLVYLHEQKPMPVIYRDLKPSNIIILANGNIKLIDFGIAREFKSHKEKDTVCIGTKGYAAPEQYGWGQTDCRTDIYSLGIILYQSITGLSPYDVDFSVSKCKTAGKDIPDDIYKIILKSTDLKPENRYKSAREFLYELDKINRKNKNDKKITNHFYIIPDDYKKVIMVAGEENSGRSTIIKGISENFSGKKRIAVVDFTKECLLYRKIGLREDMTYPGKTDKAECGIKNLLEGKLAPVTINKTVTFYLSRSKIDINEKQLLSIINILKANNETVIFMADIDKVDNLFKHMDNVYLVKDMSPYSCYKYNNFLKQNAFNKNYKEKLRFIINKHIKTVVKTSDIVNTCCDEMDEDINIKFFEIPFETEIMIKSLENEKYEGFHTSNYSKIFKKAIKAITEDIYPLKNKKSID